jgi:hypothetical protein
VLQVNAQIIKPDLQDTARWVIVNRKVELVNQDGKKSVRFNEVPNEGFMILKEIDFTNGTIEFDVQGKNLVQQSFVGLVFHGKDEKTYDVVYFRPFNFKSNDSARRAHAVQYISIPGYDWPTLRNDFPGKYENNVNPEPNPDDWFHAMIVVDGKKISVFVNNSARPSLQVEKLSNTNTGGIALWMGNNSGGTFSNLTITPANSSSKSNNTVRQ